MDPLYPGPFELVGANLRRAYRGTPPDALPERLATLLSQIAARTAMPTSKPDDTADKMTRRPAARPDSAGNHPTLLTAKPAQTRATARAR
jgi:hypothetical protein